MKPPTAEPVRRCGLIALTALALAVLPDKGAWAGFGPEGLSSASLAIAAYEVSRQRCAYSDAVGRALADIDVFLGRGYGGEWARAKAAGPDLMSLLRNAGRMMGSRSECATFGKAVGGVLPVYREAGGTDAAVMAEFRQLSEGGGRSPNEEPQAPPPPPLPPPEPGPAAAMVRELNRQHPDMNRSAETEFGSTLRRRQQDNSPTPAPLTDRAPRPAAVSPATPKPLAQAAPSAPPSLATPPTPSTPSAPSTTAIPTSSAARAYLCQPGAVCRLAEPTFACNLAEAQSLAVAGATQGRQAGLAAVRAGRCEIVAAGRPLLLEATKAPGVVYASENGRHVGYLPVGVSAPAGSGAATTCTAPGFCAVRPGPEVWACPRAEDLDLPTPEARSAAKCVRFSEGQVGEASAGLTSFGPVAIALGGNPPSLPRYYIARADLVGVDVRPAPTPAARGWCRPGDWCVIGVPALFCGERAPYERVRAAPVGEARRAAILAEPTCRIMLRGNPLKPADVPAEGDAGKLVAVAHPVLGGGWTSPLAFGAVAYAVPIRYTARLSDIVVSVDRSADLTAVALSAQGTRQATGVFRAGPRERVEFCRANRGAENTAPYRTCLGEADASVTVAADCNARRLTLDGAQYSLAERPGDAEPDIHVDAQRRWLFQNLATGEWLDGSAASGELSVRTAFDALCPGTNPEASVGTAYRDPTARYPRELQGRWFSDRRACADPRRDDPDFDDYTYMQITADAVLGRGSEDRVNAVRQLGRGTWAIDEGGKSQEGTDTFSTATYTLTREGFSLTANGHRTEWVRCR